MSAPHLFGFLLPTPLESSKPNTSLGERHAFFGQLNRPNMVVVNLMMSEKNYFFFCSPYVTPPKQVQLIYRNLNTGQHS